jgi:hypothetical protein
MGHRAIAAAAATSVLLMGAALPAFATEPSHSTETPAESPTNTEAPTCDELGLETLLASAEGGGANQNELGFGVVRMGETETPQGTHLDVSLFPGTEYVIKKVVVTGASGQFRVWDTPTHEGDQWVGLYVGDVGNFQLITHWVVCGEKIGATPSPTDTEPTTEPSHAGSPKPTHSKSPKAVPTNIPAGSGSSTNATPWALFGMAIGGAMAAAGVGTVVRRCRNATAG